jgi:predicted RNA binding protein YcfA (HicA-like mRNA interferase family)
MYEMQKNVWDQLRSTTSKQIYNALIKDKTWVLVSTKGAQQIFRNKLDGRNVSIHLHPTDKCGYGPKLIKELIEFIGWTEDELKHYKLIK